MELHGASLLVSAKDPEWILRFQLDAGIQFKSNFTMLLSCRILCACRVVSLAPARIAISIHLMIQVSPRVESLMHFASPQSTNDLPHSTLHTIAHLSSARRLGEI
jgi:hypothetical protein